VLGFTIKSFGTHIRILVAIEVLESYMRSEIGDILCRLFYYFNYNFK